MSDFRFGDVGMLHWLWLVPSIAALMAFAARRRSRALRRFIHDGLLDRVAGSALADPARRVLKGALLLSSVALLVVALARPGWNAVREDVSQVGRDVVFLLDVSRSMLAEDLPPNRLERAKLAIRDAVDRLDGDRVALAVFAGSTVVKCPLTVDYGFFRMALDDVTPGSVTRGGSLIGDALRRIVADVFDAKRTNFRDIVLITDGEDHESFPVEAAAQAGEQGVRLIAVGLGDERLGQRIPAQAQGSDGPGGRTFLRHQGQEVWSKLDADTLRRMAEATPGGAYLNVATGTVDLGDIYARLIAPEEGQEYGSRTVERVEEKFQLFLLGCLILLALELALRERASRGAALLAGCWLALGGLAQDAGAASVRGLVNGGNESYRAEDYSGALSSYDRALEQEPGSAYAAFNRANALYRAGKFAEAADSYAAAVRDSAGEGLGRVRSGGLHGLGNARFREAEAEFEGNPGSALRLLESAAQAYADAVRADRGRADSAHNLELSRRRIEELRERASQQSPGGQGESGEGDQQDRQQALRQAAEEQERLADQSQRQSQDRQRRPGEDARAEQRERESELGSQQGDLQDRTRELAEDAGQEAQDRLEDAAQHQSEAQESLAQGEPGEAERSQREAAEALRQAAAAEGAQPGNDEQARAGDPGSEAAADPDAALPEMTAEQILAKERQDRQQRQLQRVGVIAVERDW